MAADLRQSNLPEEKEMSGRNQNDNCLMHHGVRGQKWHVKHGPPYPLRGENLDRAKRDWSTMKLDRGTQLIRYSSKKERKIKPGTYSSYHFSDVGAYGSDMFNGFLGVQNPKKVFEMHIDAIDDVQIRKGIDVVEDVLKEIGDEKADKIFNQLKIAGYFDQNITPWKKFDIYQEYRGHARSLAKTIHQHVYKDRKAFSKKYLEQNYDAIVDPEDYVWGYMSPLIITNASKFKISEVENITKLKKQYLGG